MAYPEPRDVPAPIYDRIEELLGAYPHEVSENDHEAGAWLTEPLGAIVLINCRYVTPEGHLLFRGQPLRRKAN